LRLIDDAQEHALVRDGVVTLADFDLAIAEERPWATAPAIRRAAAVLAEEARPVSLGRVGRSILGRHRGRVPRSAGAQPSGGVSGPSPSSRDSIVGRANARCGRSGDRALRS
jgi:hypothetical protein